MQELNENQFGVEGAGETAPSGRDRRRHSRYAVAGEAEVIIGDGALLFRGSIFDISLSGCFIATSARLTATPGTRASLVFRAAGILLRAEASLRSVRPGRGAGFLFVEMNERARHELTLLIAACERSAV